MDFLFHGEVHESEEIGSPIKSHLTRHEMNPPTENVGPKSFYTQEYVGSVWLPYALPYTFN